MPKEYLKEKRALIRKGVPVKKAKRIAAIDYNKKHPNNPVTKDYDKKHSTKVNKNRKKAKSNLNSQMNKSMKILGY